MAASLVLALVCASALCAQTFTPTGSMNEARVQHTATLLNNGKVLVTGGPSATAEIYDPATGTWRYALHSMAYARQAHTAVKLNNGKVLIAGGTSSPAAGEVFDPATEQFTLTNAMNAYHGLSPGILLNDGRALLITGSLWFFGVGFSEIYDPFTNSWTTTPAISVGFSLMAGVVLADGTVLAVEGYDGYTPTAYPFVQRYNPAINTVTAMANAVVSRLQHTATLMPDGKILIAAGSDPSYSVASTELYDPAAPPNGQSQLSTSLNQGRRGHTATLMPNGDVLVVGGSQSAHGCCFAANLSLAELRDHSSGIWTPAGNTAVPRGYGHTATLLPSGTVLVTGGATGFENRSSLNTAEIWNAGAAGGATFDAFADFSILANPNGVWSYGYTMTLGSLLIPHSTAQADFVPGVDRWVTPSIDYWLMVGKNKTGANITTAPPTAYYPSDMLLVHPTVSWSYSVVRWTAPAGGTYSFTGKFAGLDSVTSVADTDVHILHNSITDLLAPTVLRGVGTEKTFSISRAVAAGDTIDFAVGKGPSGFHQNDSTGLKVSITGPPASVTTGTIHVSTNLPAATFTITGPATYTGGGTSFTQAGAPAGTYTIKYNPVAGYFTPPEESKELLSGKDIVFSQKYLLPGTIVVSANIPGVQFKIEPAVPELIKMGPTTYPVSSSNVAPGSYKLTFLPAAGYSQPVPNPLQQTVTSGATAFFVGNYTPIGSKGVVVVNTSLDAAAYVVEGPIVRTAWTITIPNRYTGKGRSLRLDNMDPGLYTITYQRLDGYVSPPAQSLELKAGQYVNFTGTYQRVFLVSFTGWKNSPDPGTEYPPGYFKPELGMTEIVRKVSPPSPEALSKVRAKAFTFFGYRNGGPLKEPSGTTKHEEAVAWLSRQQPTTTDRVVLIGHGYGGHRAKLMADDLFAAGTPAYALVTVDPIDWSTCDALNFGANGDIGSSPCNQGLNDGGIERHVVNRPQGLTKVLSYAQRNFLNATRGYNFAMQPFTLLNPVHALTDRDPKVSEDTLQLLNNLNSDPSVRRILLLSFTDLYVAPDPGTEYPEGYTGVGMTDILKRIKGTPELQNVIGKSFTFFSYGNGSPLVAPLDDTSAHVEAYEWLTKQNLRAEDRVFVLGHSYGGNRARLFAQNLYDRQAASVDGLVTVDAVDWMRCRSLEPVGVDCNQSGDLKEVPTGVGGVLSHTQQGTLPAGYSFKLANGVEVSNIKSTTLAHTIIDDDPGVQQGIVQFIKRITFAPKTAGHSVADVHVEALSSTSVQVGWTTRFLSTSWFEVSRNADMSSPLATADLRAKNQHSLVVNGLSPSTAYYYRVRSVMADGREAVSPVLAFVSLPALVGGVPIVRIAPQSGTRDSGTVTLNVAIANIGSGVAKQVRITQAVLGGKTSTSIPWPRPIGDLAGAATVNIPLTFPATVGASGTPVPLLLTVEYIPEGQSKALTVPFNNRNYPLP